jgi:hypothetical protein
MRLFRWIPSLAALVAFLTPVAFAQESLRHERNPAKFTAAFEVALSAIPFPLEEDGSVTTPQKLTPVVLELFEGSLTTLEKRTLFYDLLTLSALLQRPDVLEPLAQIVEAGKGKELAALVVSTPRGRGALLELLDDPEIRQRCDATFGTEAGYWKQGILLALDAVDLGFVEGEEARTLLLDISELQPNARTDAEREIFERKGAPSILQDAMDRTEAKIVETGASLDDVLRGRGSKPKAAIDPEEIGKIGKEKVGRK